MLRPLTLFSTPCALFAYCQNESIRGQLLGESENIRAAEGHTEHRAAVRTARSANAQSLVARVVLSYWYPGI